MEWWRRIWRSGRDLVVWRLVQMGLVGAIIFVSMTVSCPWSRSMRVSTSASQSVQMSGLSVLHLWGFNWDSIVDDWNVLRSVPGPGSMVSWSMGYWSVVWCWSMVRICRNLSVGSSVECLGMLNFRGFDWDAIVDLWDMDGSVPLLSWGIMMITVGTSWGSMSGNMGMGSEVSSLGSSHLWGIGRNVRSGTDRSQQQH